MRKALPGHALQHGFTLAELMVSLVLGLLVIGGVLGAYLASHRTYRTNENLARMQENARFAFEVMAHDIREAGGIPCGSNLPTANALNNASANWWSRWGEGVRGYEGNQTLPAMATGSGAASRISGTDAVVVWSGNDGNNVTIVKHNPASAEFKVNTTAHGFVNGDLLLACDFRQAAIFQATNADSKSDRVVHNTGGARIPGNCSKGLGYPTDCSSQNGNPYAFAAGGVLTRLTSRAWYVGYNGRGSRSLYRVNLGQAGGNAITGVEEMAEGVNDLQVQYLQTDANGVPGTSYVDATSVSDWTRVISARLAFTLASLENAGADNRPLTRKWDTVISLRNRIR